MLVLTRKNGQKLMIGDNIELVIIESSNNLVKLGIMAPREVSIYREEVYIEIKKANEKSNTTSCDSVAMLQNIIFSSSACPKSKKLDSLSTKVKNEQL